MSTISNDMQFRRGARVTVKGANGKRRIELPLAPAPAMCFDADAYDLAKANMHKPWARRWMAQYIHHLVR